MSENRCCGGLAFRNMVLRGDGSSIIYGAFYKRGTRITDFSDKSITCVVLTLEEQEVCALDDITTAEDGSVCILIAPNTLGEGRYYYHISLKDFNGSLIAEYKNEMDIVAYSEPCEESFNKEGISSFFAVERVLKGEDGVGISGIELRDNHLYVTLTDARVIDAGEIDVVSEESASIVTVTPTTDSNYAQVYTIKQGTKEVGKINIPKDKVVESGEIVVNPEGLAAGTYIKLGLQNVATPLYINVGDLVDVYTAQASATQVQVAISNANVISATIVAGSIGSTELATDAVVTAKIKNANVTKAKLESSVQTSLDKADAAAPQATTYTKAEVDAMWEWEEL